MPPRLYDGTRVTDLAERLKMFDETPAQLKARHDPLLDFAFALEPERQAWQAGVDARDGAIARLRPEWRKAVLAHAGKPVAPDANGTLRVSFAHVKGYSPRDGVIYSPQTTLAGMIEKNTGKEPFAVPPFILDAAERRQCRNAFPSIFSRTRIQPAAIPEVPWSTGGASSSASTSIGRGKTWPTISATIPDVARNISVDIRFLRWLLEDVQNGRQYSEGMGREALTMTAATIEVSVRNDLHEVARASEILAGFWAEHHLPSERRDGRVARARRDPEQRHPPRLRAGTRLRYPGPHLARNGRYELGDFRRRQALQSAACGPIQISICLSNSARPAASAIFLVKQLADDLRYEFRKRAEHSDVSQESARLTVSA